MTTEYCPVPLLYYIVYFSFNYHICTYASNLHHTWPYSQSDHGIKYCESRCIDPWVLEFVVSNVTGNNQWENCISLDFYFPGLNSTRNQRKLEPHD